MLMLTPQYITE